MKRSIIFSLICLLSVFSISCKKWVEVPPPQNQLISSLAFSDDKTANATVAGLYSVINSYNNSFGNANASFFPAFGADEFKYALANLDYDEFANGKLTPGNSRVRLLWSELYSLIYHANAILEGLENSNNVSQAAKTQYMGEALFLRGYFYFYLVNYFGDVPLILNTNYKINTSLPREKKELVYESIVNDFVDAQKNLPDALIGNARTRANKAAATTMLARTYLYLGKWALAETEANKVIGDVKYSLLKDLNQIFLKNSNEAILQWQSVNTSTAGVNTWEGFSIVPPTPTGRAYYNVYDSFYKAFEEGDKRKNSWINSYILSGTTYYYPYKYKIRTASTVEEYTMVLRYAELFLIRAEARAHLGKYAEALEDLASIRNRAGLPALAATTSENDILKYIEQERRIELFGEWGHRWFDLRRTGRSLPVLSPIKPSITVNDLYYPIPQDARNTNPNLGQNDGYN